MKTKPIHGLEAQRALLRNLSRELFQTEVSAARHCRREARRNPGSPPAETLLLVAAHADAALRELTELASLHGLPRSSFGMLLGALFSEARERVADHLIDAERSYRGTLLGMRHGLDVMRMFGACATLAQYDGLSLWAESWLALREPLVDEAERQLAWFALHADRALARAH
ncbi:MAG TPA: hypothetical protein VFZ61_21440 [Polyangiales bacterium]